MSSSKPSKPLKLVLLPGLHGSAELFQPLLAHLPSHIDCQVITYPSGVKLDYQQLLNLVLSQLPKQDFVLLGESFSGPIVYKIAFNKPQHLKQVIFVGSFLNNPRPLLLNFASIALIGLFRTLPTAKTAIKHGLTGQAIGVRILSACKQAIDRLPPGLVTFRLLQILRLRGRHWPCQCPALYLQGQQDRLIPSRCLAAFKIAFPELTIRTLPGPHFLLQAQPRPCANIISETLDRLERVNEIKPTLLQSVC